MKRRDFLKRSSLVSMPLMLGGLGVSSVKGSKMFDFINPDNEKILVLIFLNGGNDGLNTLIPMNYYDELQDVRPNIILPENQLIQIDGDNAFHPGMQGFADLYNDSQLQIVQGVAYPNQNRSHFRSVDIWNTASAADEFWSDGWIGRYLDELHPTYPDNYPSSEFPDPLALTIEYGISETCQGAVSNFSLSMPNESAVSSVPDNMAGLVDLPCYGDELKFITESIQQLNLYSERLSAVYDSGTNLSTKYDESNDLANKLKLVARMINGGSQTKVYVIDHRGFDTHANQVVESDTDTGTHAELLSSLSDAVAAFQDDINLMDKSEDVLGMTYSEFGRRIRSNAGIGTDHGTAAPLFLFGGCVKGTTLGQNPEINSDVDSNAGVEMQYDFRSVYATVLRDWFDMDESKISTVMNGEFQYLPILNDCLGPVSTEDTDFDITMNVYPNPTADYLNVACNVPQGLYSITVYNSLGSLVHHELSRTFSQGEHRINMNVSHLVSGNYVLRLANEQFAATKRFVKM